MHSQGRQGGQGLRNHLLHYGGWDEVYPGRFQGGPVPVGRQHPMDYYYTIPSHVHKKCRQLRDNLKEMRKEEYRLKQREKEGLSLAIKGIVISLMYGNTIMALTLGLVTFLYTGYREGTIEATQDAQRNAREELAAIKEQYYYNNPFSQQKEEEQQVRRGGGFRR